MSNFEFSKTSLRRLEGVNSKLIELMKKSLTVSPIDFGIPKSGGFRTADEQNFLFEKNRTKCDGYEKKSKHQQGLAVDVYAYVNGQASWDESHLSMIAGVVLSTAHEMGLQVRWGGTFGTKGKKFKGWDMPHFELIT